jgi:hypothetical protein
MRLDNNLGTLLLAVWLIVMGLRSFGLAFPNLDIMLSIVAIVAGVLILLGR